MTCPKCGAPLERYQVAWLAAGPMPQAERCTAKSCGARTWTFQVEGGEPLVLDPNSKPRGLPVAEWVQDELLRSRLH
ncbi:MAG: hypothetical protein COU35_03800 [Candidatus Magasanikbacteria bacterium CG10_big_fil_rev_8_21_14_0_10_47_10]|uniref:Uncharacterized protein n=1 Tax=Candidatus Magasanikbacteria bacterium CG10_big_fil_rev_8_21_14_0_10_47_10 TaxID=1974652 RepID=A0A2H0TPT8_9BACT|nr:MAG: hypothetical protein COU35_03800 [Candidatus Magasanikbacteria bacterium CG10_big_fil_rev_8_21_14_0_10_47_10]